MQGCKEEVNLLITQSQGEGGINTAFIERLNAIFRQRLAILDRCTWALACQPQTIEASMYLLRSVYNFCTYHKSLHLPLLVGSFCRRWMKRTPAMAAGLADHRWTIYELLHFKVPVQYQPPKRRGRPQKTHCPCGFT